VKEGAIAQDCRIKGMGVMYKDGIIDYSVSGLCGRDRDSGVKGGGEGEGDKEREVRKKRKGKR
jgi:hypothetical protein